MKKLIIIIIVLFCQTNIFGQVKIGDNPNTINANSMLELESTNKGFLPPRVALSSVNSTTPLTASTPTGMIVYSLNGSVADGYYYWNGVKWLGLSTSSTKRDNYVLVKSASDLPAAVGGIITLAANTLYEINGTISLTDKIDLNGNTIIGMDHMNDKLLYTPGSGELFTGSNGGTIKMVTLSAPSAKVFNLDAANAEKNIILQSILIFSCNTIGTIKGFAGETMFEDVFLFNNSNGITFENNEHVNMINLYWDESNANTFEKYTGSFGHIRRTGGDAHALLANSAVAIDVSGITSLTSGDLKQVTFLGDGTFVSGSFSNAWEVEAHGLATEKDETAGGNFYVSTTALTSIATIDVPIKISGTTLSATLFRFTMPSSNRLTYIGAKSRRFQVVCSITSSAASNNKNFSYHIYKNGVKLPESTQSMKMGTGINAASLTISCNVLLSINDYIEVWVENNSDSSDITITNMNLSVK